MNILSKVGLIFLVLIKGGIVRKKIRKISALFFLAIAMECSMGLSGEILMVGLDKNGAPVEVLVPESQYKDNLKKALVEVHSSTLPVLEAKSDFTKGWMLRTVVVGVGVNMELGIGEAKFGILPRFRVGFSNAKEPSVP